MTDDLLKQKTDILEKALTHIPFDGWSDQAFFAAAKELELEETIIPALFPRGVTDYLKFYAQWADNKMLEALKAVNPDDLKIRARVRIAVEKRLEALAPYKDITQQALKIYARPQHARSGLDITWRTADVIWTWAGDTAEDYNYYTKRGLLSGVIGSTMLYWFRDESENYQKTRDFLNKRIENVVRIGGAAGKVIKPLETALNTFIMPQLQSLKDRIKWNNGQCR